LILMVVRVVMMIMLTAYNDRDVGDGDGDDDGYDDHGDCDDDGGSGDKNGAGDCVMGDCYGDDGGWLW